MKRIFFFVILALLGVTPKAENFVPFGELETSLGRRLLTASDVFTVSGNAVFSGDIDLTGDFTVTGDTFAGDVEVETLSVWSVTGADSITSFHSLSGSYDVGLGLYHGASLKWKLYTPDLSDSLYFYYGQSSQDQFKFIEGGDLWVKKDILLDSGNKIYFNNDGDKDVWIQRGGGGGDAIIFATNGQTSAIWLDPWYLKLNTTELWCNDHAEFNGDGGTANMSIRNNANTADLFYASGSGDVVTIDAVFTVGSSSNIRKYQIGPLGSTTNIGSPVFSSSHTQFQASDSIIMNVPFVAGTVIKGVEVEYAGYYTPSGTATMYVDVYGFDAPFSSPTYYLSGSFTCTTSQATTVYTLTDATPNAIVSSCGYSVTLRSSGSSTTDCYVNRVHIILEDTKI